MVENESSKNIQNHKPSEIPKTGEGSRKERRRGKLLSVRSASSVKPEALEWLLRGKIPLAKLTAMDGNPGTGKTALLLDVAARVSTGSEMPDGAMAPSGRVLILNREDGAGDTIRPRLEAAGADLDRIVLFSEGAPSFSIDEHSDALLNTLEENECALCVVDTLASALGPEVNVRSTKHMTRTMQKLAKVAAKSGAAVVVTRHLRKSDKPQKAIQAGTDSISISGTARSVLLVAESPNNPNVGILASAKTNLGSKEDARSLSFEIESHEAATGSVARVNWLGPSLLSADDLLGEDKGNRGPALERATDWLKAALASDPMSATELSRLADQAGHAVRTLDRAKKAAGVVSKKGADGTWTWQIGDKAS